jgi:hypothetical protein
MALKARAMLDSEMPRIELEAEAVRRQLKRVLDSTKFARNDRLSRFLRFVVEMSLEGRASELKESVIATEAIGREPDYNPSSIRLYGLRPGDFAHDCANTMTARAPMTRS